MMQHTQFCAAVVKKKAVFGTASKHPIWLGSTFGNKVVNQNTNVTFVTSNNEWSFIPGFLYRIDSSDNPLPCSFFITRSSVDLTGKK